MIALLERHGSRRPSRGRLLRLLLAIVLLSPVLATQVPVQPVRADALADAVAEQKKLAKLIAEEKKQLANLGEMQKDLQGQIASTRQSLVTINKSLDELQAQIGSLRSQIALVQTTYDGLVGRLDDLQSQLIALEATEAAKQAELERRQQILADRLVAAYEADQISLLQQMLTAHSLTDVLSDVSYYMDMGAADEVLAEEIKADQATLAQIHSNVAFARDATALLADQVAAQKKQLDAEMAQLNAAQAQLDSLQRKTAAQLAAQRAADAKVAKDKAKLAAAIKSNGEAQTQLAKKIDQLISEEAGKGRIPSDYNGTFKWPMGGVVTQEFGCTGFYAEPRVGTCAHFHIGIDIAAPCGTQIRAAGPGTVVFVGYNPYDAPPRAWLVIIAHSTSLNTWYAHMTARAPSGISVGAHVSAGQLVGWENTTGHSTGCHLHWAVRVNGKFSNPRLFV